MHNGMHTTGGNNMEISLDEFLLKEFGIDYSNGNFKPEILKLREQLMDMMRSSNYIYMEWDILSLLRYIKYEVFDADILNFKRFMFPVLKDDTCMARFKAIGKIVMSEEYKKPKKFVLSYCI